MRNQKLKYHKIIYVHFFPTQKNNLMLKSLSAKAKTEPSPIAL